MAGVDVNVHMHFCVFPHATSQGLRRFSELQELLPKISRQMLSLELSELEQMQVICRRESVLGNIEGIE